MNGLMVVARLYVTEALRRHVHLVTLFLVVVLFSLPVLLRAFGLTAFERVTKDFGLTLIGYFGIGLALFLGSTAIPADLERRSVYPLLARPIPRSHYLLGKMAGVSAILLASLVLLGTAFLVSLALLMREFDPRILMVVGFQVLESMLIAAVCLAVSIFASPAMTAVVGLFVYIVGGLSEVFIQFFLEAGSQATPTALLARALKGMLPHFELFHVKDAVVHALPLPGLYAASVLAYGAAWLVLILMIGNWGFARRDL